MSYFSDFYVESFASDVLGKFVILLNQIQIHNKEKYLLIVAQDVNTLKIVRLIDFHGKMYDLYKYNENWAQLKKGDVIKVRCKFHESVNCVNVLRVISDYQLIENLNYYSKIREKWELFNDLLSESDSDFINENSASILMPKKTDLAYLAKKLKGRYGFVLYPLYDSKLVHYQTKKNVIKYQFEVTGCYNYICYADILSYVKDIDYRIGDLYTGFVLMEFKYHNTRLRLKVYDFLNEDDCFKEPQNYNTISTSNLVNMSEEDDVNLPF